MENGGDNNTTEEVMDEKPVADIKPADGQSAETKTDEKAKSVDDKVEDKKPVDDVSEEKKSSDDKPEEKKSTDDKTEEKKIDDKPEVTKATEETKTENVKNDEVSKELLEKIKSQVEFYFGDINLQRDKFLIEQTKLDEGWIPLTVMLTFKLLASMSKDQDVILKALESSDLIEISEDRKKIRRSPERPLPVFDEAYRKAQAERTVYVKGFPLTDIYIQKLKEFFKDYEPIENIIMRKYQDSEKKLQFKGSIFIQFKTLEGAKAFVAKESIKYGDTSLIRKFSEDYAVEKAKEKEERKLKKGEKKEHHNDEHVKDVTEEESEKSGLPKGSILHFKGVTAGTLREVIKADITKLGGVVAFIDYQKGDKEGWIRLQDENTGKAVIDKMEDNTLTINEDKVTFRLLEGEEEENYLKSVRATIKNLRNRAKAGKRGRSRRGQRGRKRHGSPAHGAVPAKRSGSD